MSDVVNLNSVFKVKNPATGSWEQVPAVKGTSVYTLEATSTSRPVSGKTQTGYILKVLDEKKQLIDPSYEYDSFIVWNGVDGDGTVNTIDGIGHDSGSLNVTLNAVRYAQLSEEEKLTPAEQSQARANINAFKDIAVTSAEDGYLPKYSALSGLWTAASLEVSEVANAVPSARKVNNYPLSADISLNPNDIGAIHSSLTINNVSINNPTTSDASINLTPANISALHAGFTINNISVTNPYTANAAITLNASNIGAVPSNLIINGYNINDVTTDSANIDTRVISPSVTVPTGAWTSDALPAGYSEAGFQYKANIILENINTSMVPQVNFSLQDSISGLFAPIATTVEVAAATSAAPTQYGVQIYASDVPENDIIIPTIICFK